MSTCEICQNFRPAISKELGVCLACIRRRPDEALPRALEAHRRSRAAFGLPAMPPCDPQGISCRICVKFDLKAWDENLHIALTGITNRRTLENFRWAASQFGRRCAPPPVIASTLLVSGYVDEHEVRRIARFIASINPEIPYSLLGFYPDFFMRDLPATSHALAEKCLAAARQEGLKKVNVGNVHLLT